MELIDFPVAIDATEKLPSRSVMLPLPCLMAFPFQRPSLWRNRMEIAPGQMASCGCDYQRAKRGIRHAHRITCCGWGCAGPIRKRLNVTPAPVETDTVARSRAVRSSRARYDAPKTCEALPTPKLAPSATVKTVKVVPVELRPFSPHDGAFAFGAAGDAAEWVEIIRPVLAARAQSNHRKR